MRITSGLLTGHVLQRTAKGASVTVRGECAEVGAVTASISAGGSAGRKVLKGWSGKVVGKATKGAFSATLSGIPTGGPYTVTLELGKRRVVVQQIFVGDLWLMAGQSNMEGVGNLCDAPKPHPLVRNFNMDHRWSQARDPLHHLPESPDTIHNGGSQQPLADRDGSKLARITGLGAKGTGVGVYFGIEMHRRTGVPQGLIATAHGGSSMDQWDPAKRDQGGASLYGSMLSSLAEVSQPIAGVLWYQGCSDTDSTSAQLFTERMKKLVAAVRADQHQPTLPWITVQISRVVGQNNGGEREWNAIQEQQRVMPTVIPHLETVVAIDLELDDLIHISGKAYATLGLRMARAAARLAHQDEREVPAIQVTSIKEIIHGTAPALEVVFSNVVGELRSAGLPLGFTLVDSEHRKHDLIYKTTLDANRAILELVNNHDADLRVMYGWGKAPACTISDSRGMAIPVFGPLARSNRQPMSPGVRTWDMSKILAGEELKTMRQPTLRSMGPVTRRVWADNFINNHDTWQHTTGHVAFFSSITLAEAMELELRTGYDGPFRLWIDSKGIDSKGSSGKEVITDLKGTNPAILDSTRKNLKLAKGTHRITVLMSLNGGKAWGFFLRFARLKVPATVLAAGSVALPVPLKN